MKYAHLRGFPLSARQREVMHLVAQGESDKVIADHLGIEHRSVREHMTIVLRKAGAKNRAHASAMFARGEI